MNLGQQQVVPRAYRWMMRMGPGGWYQEFLVLPPDWLEVATARYYPLMDRMGLFSEFAATEPTRDSILAFVNRNGLLGGRVSLPTRDPEDWLAEKMPDFRPSLVREQAILEQVEGEALVDWQAELESAKALDALWQATQDPAGSGRRAIRDLIVRVRALPSPRQPFEFPGEVTPEEPTHPAADPPRDLVRAARALLASEVNRRIDRDLAPHVEWNDGPQRGFVLVYQPRSLISAIWLQFAHAISGTKKEFRKCEMCPTRFEVSSEGANANKRYCAVACRLKAARVRKARALDLHDEGRTFDEIAAEVGSDVDTVIGWIEERAKMKKGGTDGKA